MGDGSEVVPLEEYGRRVKDHKGDYIIPNHLMALLTANNQNAQKGDGNVRE